MTRIPYRAEQRFGGFTPDETVCHDCGARPGEIHQEGCDWEECETCGKQRIGCSCCVVCRAHENKGTWCVCGDCIERARGSSQEQR